MAFAGPLLAKIDQLKIEAEGMGELMGFVDVEPIEQLVLGLSTRFAAEMPSPFRKLPDLVQMVEHAFPGLFRDDFVQPRGQLPDLFFEKDAHSE